MRDPEKQPLYQRQVYAVKENRYSLLYISIMGASLAGFLIGYDIFILSGALVYLKTAFTLTTVQLEVVVSSALIVAAIGAVLGWPVCKSVGRKKAIIISALLFIAGSMILCSATSYLLVIIGRSILGLAIGLVSMSSLIYLSEIVPANIRGSSVCLLNLAYYFGVFLAYCVAWALSSIQEWRWMLASSLIPAAILFVLIFFVPETPQWYASHGKTDLAKQVLYKLRRYMDVQFELEEIQESVEHEKAKAKSFWTKGVFKSLFIGFFIAVFMEFTGLNAILYYAPTLLRISGYDTIKASIVAGLSIALTSLVFSFIAILFIDVWGRRKILITGISTMLIGLLGAGFVFKYCIACQTTQGFLILFLIIFAAGFSIGLGAVGWLLISEIYPLRIRSFAVATSITIKWASSYLIARYFLSVVDLYGVHITFWIYSGISLMALLFTYFFVPETLGKTLEEIEEFWLEERKHGTTI